MMTLWYHLRFKPREWRAVTAKLQAICNVLELKTNGNGFLSSQDRVIARRWSYGTGRWWFWVKFEICQKFVLVIVWWMLVTCLFIIIIIGSFNCSARHGTFGGRNISFLAYILIRRHYHELCFSFPHQKRRIRSGIMASSQVSWINVIPHHPRSCDYSN